MHVTLHNAFNRYTVAVMSYDHTHELGMSPRMACAAAGANIISVQAVTQMNAISSTVTTMQLQDNILSLQVSGYKGLTSYYMLQSLYGHNTMIAALESMN